MDRVDCYGRLLSYVYLLRKHNPMFNETLVREGYARMATFPPNVRYANHFLAAQREAMAAGVGIWSRDGCAASDPAPGLTRVE